MKRERRVPFLLFVVCLVAAMPFAWGAGGVTNSTIMKPAGMSGGASTDVSAKVTLCHVPPGNPSNAQTIVLGRAAVSAHLAHGDYLGECHPACAGVTCTASDQCHVAGTCDPQTGTCSTPNAPNGTACDDGNPATTSDQCTNGACGGTVVCAGAPSPVPKTGQTGCWDALGEPIACAGTGQDGEYRTGASVDPRFTDNADGTVSDNLTGLIWLKDADCFGLQSWTAALITSNTLASGDCGLTDGSAAGAWRLPNVKELQALIDFAQFDPALPAGSPFIGVQSALYWSSTSYANAPAFAWYVILNDGTVSNATKTNPFHVWPVRGGQ